MMKMLSLKPYLIRAYYEWICESGGTPHLLVQADLPNVNVPGEYIDLDDYTILLNISSGATNQFLMGKNAIYFQARFSGVVCDIQVPYYAIMSLYAEENEQGIVFDIDMDEVNRDSKGFVNEQKYPQAPLAEKKNTPPPYLRVVTPEDQNSHDT